MKNFVYESKTKIIFGENQIENLKKDYAEKIAKFEGNNNKITRIERSYDNKLDKKNRVLEEGNILMRWGEPLSVYNEETIQKTQTQMNQYLQNRGYFNGSAHFITTFKRRRAYVTYFIEEDKPHIIDAVQLITADTTIKKLINH